MTPKQQAFVNEYLIDLNATQAAIRAGYSPRTANEQASRLLAKDNISAAVAEAQAKRAEETGITARWVLTEAADVYREARQDGDRGNALKALDLCGKHVDVAAFKEKLEVSGPDNGPIEIRRVIVE